MLMTNIVFRQGKLDEIKAQSLYLRLSCFAFEIQLEYTWRNWDRLQHGEIKS